ncbi:hypothetical protein [Pseudoroseicyclus sp. CXY001]|uniref:hypothetical protein n=1 Tax=Pseudoroseicyclus sp. CXY001 TaxID=3242492 RepID=UPI0035712D32
MVGSSKILTVSYGTFSCTLEGFDDSFGTMKAIAEYFRDLAADDRYFGAEPPTPDADMLARIAEREIARRVEARQEGGGIVLRAAQLTAPEAAPAPVEPPEAASQEADDEAPAPAEAAEDNAADSAETAEDHTPAMPPSPRQPAGAGGSVADKLARIRAVVGTGAAAVAGAAAAEVEDAEEVAGAPAEPAPEAAGSAEMSAEPEVAEATAWETAEDTAAEAEVEEEANVFAEPDLAEPDLSETYEPAPTGEPPFSEEASEARAEDLGLDLDVPAGAEDEALAEEDELTDGMTDEELEALAAALEAGDGPAFETALAMPYDSLSPAEQEGAQAPAAADPAHDPAQEAAPAPQPDAAGTVGPAVPESEEVGAEETDSPFVGTLSDSEEAELLAELAALEADDEDAAFASAAPIEPEARVGQHMPTESMDTAGEIPAEEALDLPDEPEDDLPEPTRFATAPQAPDVDAAPAADGWPVGEAPEALGALGEEEPPRPDPAELAAAEAELQDWAEDEALFADPEEPALSDEAIGEADGWDDDEDDIEDDEAGDAWPGPANAFDNGADDDTADDLDSDAAPVPAADSGAPAQAAWDEPRPFAAAPEADEAGLNRILTRTDEQLAEPGNSRRRAAIAQLKAAVAATEAARRLGEGDGREGKMAAFREDLDQVVRPRRPVRGGDHQSERPRTAPLKLVASQRVDMTAEEPAAAPASRPGEPIRPRRVLPGEAPAPRPMPPAAEAPEEELETFPVYAADAGAESLSDLLEAAAAYTSQIEGAEDFSRPQLMRLVGEAAPESFDREEGLRSFGTLLRQGRIVKVRSGRFALSGTSRFHPERRAG